MTQAQRRRLEAWFVVERDAGRLRTQSVYGAAGAATAALGFRVSIEQAHAAWMAAMRLRKEQETNGR